jgi:hypothetical protein
MTEENTETEGTEAEPFPEYSFHAYTNLFPRLDKKSFEKLKDDIQASGGNHTPIMVYQNEVIDGRERYDACKALNIFPTCADLEEPEEGKGVDLMAYVISANLHRRHLTTSQRAIIAGRISTGKLGDNQHTEEFITIEEAAKLLNIGDKSVKRGRKVLDECAPDVIAAVEAGTLKVSTAEKLKAERDKTAASANPQSTKTAKRLDALELLQAVYCNEGLSLPTRMRAAIASLPFERPKLGVMVQVNGNDLADKLLRAIEASRQVQADQRRLNPQQVIEAPKAETLEPPDHGKPFADHNKSRFARRF